MSNKKLSMLDDAFLEITSLRKENAALKAIVAAKPDAQQLKQAIALLEECLTSGNNSDATLVAWFHGEHQVIQQTILEAQQACV